MLRKSRGSHGLSIGGSASEPPGFSRLNALTCRAIRIRQPTWSYSLPIGQVSGHFLLEWLLLSREAVASSYGKADMDSSLSARKQLATELHYPGNQNDSATMNVWLHKQVIIKLAENGSKVPQELLS